MLTGILLAAGSASRFGANKLMHPWNDGVPIAVSALNNLQSGVNRVVAVVKDDDLMLQECLRQEGAEVIICNNAHLGISASIQNGINFAAQASGWVIALADMPAIKGSTIRAVVNDLARGAKLVAPYYYGTRGHPVGFHHQFYSELMQLRGDAGAKQLLERHGKDVSRIDCDDPGIVYDIDRPQDIRSISHL